ncbi:MarR family winged helix-turn-helix transcriptional regulator [Sulfitobacter sp. S190]|uniref:MarR family winged helix-turn-helix transcriptional regulator n=1 Tax=Sulfitobacter sp. S190 TaxID=2867022 RepID=UPI0021A39166|nr:MarR family transcriptional regulator [Sulfitobacter sp. S190]UWR24506.1 MarR family transcriptional regulator [Sulfitobacter sp. S190]
MNRQRKIDTETEHRLGEMGLENFAPYLMNRIMGRYNNAMREEMAALGLTTPQMRSLAVLSVIDGILIRELAVYAVVQQSTLSRALDALDRDGLIRRETDAEDSRATRVYLTAAGREAYHRLWPHMSAAYKAMFKGIDDDEQRAFVGTLQKMLRNIRKHDF